MEVALTPLEFARRARALYADREAVVDGDAAPHLRAVLRALRPLVARRCRRSACGQGDRVAYIAPNTHAQLESFYAVPQIGAVLVPINYRLTADDFAYIIDHSGATVVCAHADYLDAVDGIRDRSCPSVAPLRRARGRARRAGSTTRRCSPRRAADVRAAGDRRDAIC